MKKLLLYILLFVSASSFAQLNGNYTIGGTLSDFTTIKKAVDSLKTVGVSGPVVLNIATGTYNEQNALKQISGSSYTNTITFQSQSGNPEDVIITYNSSLDTNYIFCVDSTENINFKNLTFTSKSNAAILISLKGNSNGFTVDNCVFNGYETIASSTAQVSIYRNEPTTGSSLDTIKLTNSTFNNNSHAIYIYNQIETRNSYAIISNNNFNNQATSAININRFQNGAEVKNNKIISHTKTKYQRTLSTYELRGKIDISNNYIDIDDSNSSTSYMAGIVLSNNDGSISDSIDVYNNIIIMKSAYAEVLGIYGVNGSYTNIYNNTVLVQNYDTAKLSYSVMIPNSGTYGILNNNLINATEGTNSYVFIQNSASQIPSFYEFDYNNFYCKGEKIGKWRGADVNTLSEFISLSSSNNNSISELSGLAIKLDDKNYECNNSSTLFNLGTPISFIKTDYDGRIRNSSTPSIGAIEWVNPTFNIDLFATQENCPGIENTVKYVSNIQSGNFTWSDATSDISTNDSISVTLDSSTKYYILWEDELKLCSINDSIFVNVKTIPPTPNAVKDTLYCEGLASVISPLTTNSVPGTIQWFDDIELTNQVGTGTSYTPTFTELGTYMFYAVELGTNGCISLSDSVSIELNLCDNIEKNTLNNISIYPNPTSNKLFVESFDLATKIRITNILGKELLNINIESIKTEINIESFENGIYFISLYAGNDVISIQRIIKK